jgi:hypothetical protein
MRQRLRLAVPYLLFFVCVGTSWPQLYLSIFLRLDAEKSPQSLQKHVSAWCCFSFNHSSGVTFIACIELLLLPFAFAQPDQRLH